MKLRAWLVAALIGLGAGPLHGQVCADWTRRADWASGSARWGVLDTLGNELSRHTDWSTALSAGEDSIKLQPSRVLLVQYRLRVWCGAWADTTGVPPDPDPAPADSVYETSRSATAISYRATWGEGHATNQLLRLRWQDDDSPCGTCTPPHPVASPVSPFDGSVPRGATNRNLVVLLDSDTLGVLPVPAQSSTPPPAFSEDSLTVLPERFNLAVGDTLRLYAVVWSGGVPYGCDGADMAEAQIGSSAKADWVQRDPATDSLAVGGQETTKPDIASVLPGGIRHAGICSTTSGGGGGAMLQTAMRYPIGAQTGR